MNNYMVSILGDVPRVPEKKNVYSALVECSAPSGQVDAVGRRCLVLP